MNILLKLVFERCLLPATLDCCICPMVFGAIKQQLWLCLQASSCSVDVASGELWAAQRSFSAPNVSSNWSLPGAASPRAPSGTEGPWGQTGSCGNCTSQPVFMQQHSCVRVFREQGSH